MFSVNSATPHNRQTNKKLVKIIHSLLECEESTPFRKPVPHKALGLENYKNIVKKPIDLNQIRRQNNEGRYKFIEEALDDIQLCWDNCKLYNHPTSEIYQQANVLETKFKSMLAELFPEVQEALDNDEQLIRLDSDGEHFDPRNLHNMMDYEQSVDDPNFNREFSEKLFDNWSHKRNQKKFSEDKSQRKNDMDAEDDPESHLNDPMENKSMKSENREPVKEPILVNLYERPSEANIEQLNRKMRSMEESKEVVEEVLETLYTLERENVIAHKNGEISFNINQIHLTTYYRLCKILKIEPEEPLEIIE